MNRVGAHLRQKHGFTSKDSLTQKIEQFQDEIPDDPQVIPSDHKNFLYQKLLEIQSAQIEEIDEESEAVFDAQENEDSFENDGDVRMSGDIPVSGNAHQNVHKETGQFEIEEIEESFAEEFCQECPECFEQFENKDLLMFHLKNKHEIVSKL